MIKFLSDIDPLILDVTVCCIIVLIVFFGALRGLKKTIINFFIMTISLFLGFTPYVSSVKDVLIEKVFFIEKILPAGTGTFELFFCNLLGSLFASFVFFLLIYIVLHVFVLLFNMVLKRRGGNIGVKKSVVGRVFGGIISFAYGGVVLLGLLYVLNSNVVGMGEPIRQSAITKFIVTKSNDLLNKIEPDLDTKIVLKIYKGDFMAEVSESLVKSYNYIDGQSINKFEDKNYFEGIEDVAFTKEETEAMMKNYVLDLYHISVIANDFDESNKLIKDKYVAMSDEFIAVMNKTVHNNALGDLGFSIEEKGIMRSTLKEAGIDDAGLNLFDQVVEGATN